MRVKAEKIIKDCNTCAYQGQIYVSIGCARCKGNCADCGGKLRNYYPIKYYNKNK